MTAGSVPTANVQAFYNNTTSQTPADPNKIDAAMQDIVQTINDNYAYMAGLFPLDKWTNLGILNVKDYGAKGDGVTDDTSKIQDAINAANTAGGGMVRFPIGNFRFVGQLTIPSNIILSGSGYSTKLIPDNTTGNSINVTGSNVQIRNFHIESSSPGGIMISGNADNILIETCYFKTISQVVWLFACTNITVQNCTFDGTGYGVIQQNGYISSHVKVLYNTAKNMELDFIEANSEMEASEDWLVEGNSYLGNAHYSDTSDTSGERRFFGTTAIRNIAIVNNFIMNAGGDSAIHVEGVTGDVIVENNTFVDCKATQGNKGWIYLLNNAPTHISIAGNRFKKVDALYTDNYALDMSSTSQTQEVDFFDNRVIGASQNFNGVKLSDHRYFNARGNRMMDLQYAFYLHNTQDMIFDGNLIKGCVIGIGEVIATSGGTVWKGRILNNKFIGNTNDVTLYGNSNGTGNSDTVEIKSNFFDGIVRLTDPTNSATSNNDIVFIANTLSANATLYDTNAAITRYVKKSNTQVGTGVITDIP